ncbi:MAG: GntR family transcriptional regulator [Sneathiellaceae bacterium]
MTGRAASGTQFERVLLRLRGMIMAGRFEPLARLQEVELARLFEVSRTPVRLALQTLAQEGLLVYTPQRGFQVRGFSIAEIIEAIDVRGRLEAMACEQAAGKGLPPAVLAALGDNLAQTRALLRKGGFTAADSEAWSALNGEFHRMLVDASGNTVIASLLQQVTKIPFSGAQAVVSTPESGDIVFDYVQGAVIMHGLVLDAVQSGNPARARLLMEEHVYQGRERLQHFLQEAGDGRDAAQPFPMRLLNL